MIKVAAGIIFSSGKILIARRKRGEALEGFWEFPGGKIEEGETAEECLEREILEELGLKIKAGEIIAEVCHSYPGLDIILIAVTAEKVSGTITLRVHDMYEWVYAEDLTKYRFAQADIPVCRILADKLY